MRSRRPEPRGEQRERLLLAALEEQLRQRPLADVAVADITAGAGLGRSAFYFYFASKEAAVAQLLGDLFDVMLADSATFLDGPAGSRESVAASIASLVATWRRHQHVLLATADAAAVNPDVRELWQGWIDGFTAPVAAAVEAARTAGTAIPGPDASALVRALVVLNETVLETHARSTGRHDDVADVLTHIWSTALFGTAP